MAFASISVAAALCRYGLDAVSKARLLQSLNGDEERRRRFAGYFESLDRTRMAVVFTWVTADALFALMFFRLVAEFWGKDPKFHLLPTITSVTLTGIILVALGRVVPPRLAARPSFERTLRSVFPTLHVIGLVLWPFVWILLGLRRVLERMFGRSDTRLDEAFANEIIATVAEGERDGFVGEEEADMIENVVELPAFEVSEVMTPRTDVHWVEATTPVTDALKHAAAMRHSRLPVGEGDVDHIIGVFYIRDVVDRLTEIDKLKDLPVRDLCRKPLYVPETKKVSQMLKDFRENRLHIAIVLDEYGGTAGLVTIEDILEEIVGEIEDEYDPERESPLVVLEDGRSAEADAKVRIGDLNEEIHANLPESEDYETVGGFVFSQLGRIPTPGESFQYENVEVTVVSANDRKIERLRIRVLETV